MYSQCRRLGECRARGGREYALSSVGGVEVALQKVSQALQIGHDQVPRAILCWHAAQQHDYEPRPCSFLGTVPQLAVEQSSADAWQTHTCGFKH